MIGQNRITHCFVGKDLALATAGTKKSALAVGQLGVYVLGSQTSTTSALSGDTKVTIAFKNSKGVIVESQPIKYSKIVAKAKVPYSAPTYRSRAIGFNGTTGSIEDTANTVYTVNYSWYDNSKALGYGRPTKMIMYATGATTSEIDIATGIAENSNLSNIKDKLIKAEVLINSAGTAVPTGVDTIAFKNGSKYFTATNIDDATGTSAMAVGDYIRIGTGLTDPCYKIVAIDAVNNIGTISTPFQGADISGLDTTYELVVAATAASANAGVKFTGLPLVNFEPGLIRYDITEFDLELNPAFGETTKTTLSAPYAGDGTYRGVAQEEWFLKGNRGEVYRVMDGQPVPNTLESTYGKTYNTISISCSAAENESIVAPINHPFDILIFTEVPGTGTVYADLQTVFGL